LKLQSKTFFTEKETIHGVNSKTSENVFNNNLIANYFVKNNEETKHI